MYQSALKVFFGISADVIPGFGESAIECRGWQKMYETIQSVLGPFIFITFGLVIIEMTWCFLERSQVYNFKETVCNLSIFAMRRFSQAAFTAATVMPMQWVSKLTPLSMPDTWWSLLLAVVLMDFLYYWEHRLSHTTPLLWAFHEVHHSSQWFNLSTSYRLNLFDRILLPLFAFPALLLGFNPKQILMAFAINLTYQFFLHTSYVGKLGRLEGTVNTPSAHRVHHGSNPIYLDRNFGGLFMIWDQMFKTYQPETEPVVFGTTEGFVGHNPLKVVFNGFIRLIRGKREVHLAQSNLENVA